MGKYREAVCLPTLPHALIYLHKRDNVLVKIILKVGHETE